jgi:signal transduction histidine kinase
VPTFDAGGIDRWDQDVAALAGSLVHEVKNPLSTLNISAQLLLEEAGEPTTPREQRTVRRLQVMREEIARIEQIVSSFLQYVRLQSVEGRPLDLNALLSRLLSDNAERHERRKLRVHFQAEEELPPVAADEVLLRQAFLNLLQNAEQAMPEGGELIVRTLQREREAGAELQVEVIDTGVGIPAEQLEKVFRPYFSSKREGTGLGLPTVLRIVKLHGGNVRVESEPGQGSRFIVTLPPFPAGSDSSGSGAK